LIPLRRLINTELKEDAEARLVFLGVLCVSVVQSTVFERRCIHHRDTESTEKRFRVPRTPR